MTKLLRKTSCATCPFREGSPYAHLREHLERSALLENSRLCHSTGSNAINRRTGKPEAVCRAHPVWHGGGGFGLSAIADRRSRMLARLRALADDETLLRFAQAQAILLPGVETLDDWPESKLPTTVGQMREMERKLYAHFVGQTLT
jgi:hypothetical protein